MSGYQEEGRAGWNGKAGAPGSEQFGDMTADQVERSATRSSRVPPFAPDQLNAYRRTGHELIPLHVPDALDQKGRPIGKVPFKGWRQDPHLSVSEAVEHMKAGGNVGVRLRDVDLVIDVDPRNFIEGDDPLVRLEKDLGIDLTDYPRVVTGSGGFHIYMKKDPLAQLRDTLEGYQGIEFKALGRQVVAAGSVHPDAQRPYVWDDDALAVPLSEAGMAPDALIEIARRPGRIAAVDAGDRSPEQLGEMLDGIDPTQYRDHTRWLELMMACHHATAGEGRDEWIEWSTSDPVYSKDAWIIGRRWDSLHADQNGRRITEKTLFKALVDAGRKDLLPRSNARNDFPDDLPPDDTETSGGLADEYVWIVDAECFVRRRDTKKFSAPQFRSFTAGQWPDGDIVNAIFKDRLPMRKLESLVYLPDQPEFVSSPCGGRDYNIWRDSRLRAKPGDVSVFLEHMAYMFPDQAERSYVLDYLSLLVRKPSEKINFALLVRGGQGTGKSWLGKLVGMMIGEPNVARPSNTVVTDKYTDWQEGAQLAVIEELMMLGRREVANRLKPVITDDFLTIRPIYGKAYNLPNHLNLLCFTNHADALPIEVDDRRWLVVFSEAVRRDEAYYERLFAFLKGDGPAAVAHFLTERSVSLSAKGVAPITAGKEEMRKLSLGEAEQYLADRLEEGQWPFDFELVRFEDVINSVPGRIANNTRNLRGRVRAWLRDEVGARQHERHTKQDNTERTSSSLWSIVDHDRWTQVGRAARADAFATARAPQDHEETAA